MVDDSDTGKTEVTEEPWEAYAPDKDTEREVPGTATLIILGKQALARFDGN